MISKNDKQLKVYTTMQKRKRDRERKNIHNRFIMVRFIRPHLSLFHSSMVFPLKICSVFHYFVKLIQVYFWYNG